MLLSIWSEVQTPIDASLDAIKSTWCHFDFIHHVPAHSSIVFCGLRLKVPANPDLPARGSATIFTLSSPSERRAEKRRGRETFPPVIWLMKGRFFFLVQCTQGEAMRTPQKNHGTSLGRLGEAHPWGCETRLWEISIVFLRVLWGN